jgi:hypothetical protein
MGATALEAPRDFGEGFIGATVVGPFGNILGLMYNPTPWRSWPGCGRDDRPLPPRDESDRRAVARAPDTWPMPAFGAVGGGAHC